MTRVKAILTGAAVALLTMSFAPAQGLLELAIVGGIQEELNATALTQGLAALDRVKVQTTVTNLRTLSQSVESYRIQYGAYPVTIPMTCPIGPAAGDNNLGHVFTFPPPQQGGPATLNVQVDPFSQAAAGKPLPYAYFVDRTTGHYAVWSPGPDGDYDFAPVADFWTGGEVKPTTQQLRDKMMDPSNPADTEGDLIITTRPL